MGYRVLQSTMLEIAEGIQREPDTGRRRLRTQARTFAPGAVVPADLLTPEFERRFDAGDADVRSRVERVEIPGYDRPSES